MARKKQEVALQLEINSQEEWEELMQKEGLIIVDVFQDWCGPCKAVLSFFRRIKNEIGDDFLHFATAKSDTIDSLDKYRGRCEPCFLIYGGGSLVAVIRGANPPALEEIIKSKLEEEHRVMKGEIERKEIKDPHLTGVDIEEKVEKEDKDVEEIEQEVTLALIKPDVVKAEKVEEIILKLRERGIEILAQQERNLTEDEARSFYHHMENSEFFESLITFITSGPSYVLVLAKGDEGIIHEFRELIGPKVFEEAKESAPDSFRAIYGTNSIENAIHGADDKDSAHRELAFFFPDFVPPKIARKKLEDSHQQRTLALIRPAAFAEFKDSILEKIKASGFQISMQKEVKLTKEEAELFYKEHAGKPFFEELTLEMSKGTLLALALEKQHAVSGFRNILGPKDVEKAKENDPSSLRAQFSKEDITINLIHGSDSEETAQNELKYFFPVEQTIAAIKPDGAENREEIMNRIIDAGFKIVKSWDNVMTREMAEEFYADQRDQEYFEDLVSHMLSGPTLFMVLSREDAVRGWRSIMGPKDPNIAAEAYPDSIRAIYGKDVKENAVYGSENIDEASRVMNLIFGKLEFHEDGTLLPQYESVEDKPETIGTEEKIELNAKEGDDTDASHEVHEDSERTKEKEDIVTVDDDSGKKTTEGFITSSERIMMEPETAEQIKTGDDQEKTISEEAPPDPSDQSVVDGQTKSEEPATVEQSDQPEQVVSRTPSPAAETSQSVAASVSIEHIESDKSQQVESSHSQEAHPSDDVVHSELEETTIDHSKASESHENGHATEKSVSEKVEEHNEVRDGGKENLEEGDVVTEKEPTTEGGLQQDTLGKDDDSSLAASLGGPMAAGYNPHIDEPVSHKETVHEEASISNQSAGGEHSHVDSDNKNTGQYSEGDGTKKDHHKENEGIHVGETHSNASDVKHENNKEKSEEGDIIKTSVKTGHEIEEDINKKEHHKGNEGMHVGETHSKTGEEKELEVKHGHTDETTDEKDIIKTIVKAEHEIEEDIHKKDNEGKHVGEIRSKSGEEKDGKEDKVEEPASSSGHDDSTHGHEPVVDDSEPVAATDGGVADTTAQHDDTGNADTAAEGDS